MKNKTTVKRLGEKETEVIARLAYEKSTVVTTDMFRKLFCGFKPGLQRDVIHQLKSKGILKTIKNGVYFYSPLESGPSGSEINEFLVPSVLFPKDNYYIGYSTMYNFYGFIEQIFQTIFVLNTSVQKQHVIGGRQFKLIKVPQKRMYGIEKIKIAGSDVLVSDRERTLIDLIYFPDPVGGFKKAFEILKLQVKKKKIDTGKLIRYASKFPEKATRKRIGFVLEQAGLTDKELSPLFKSVKRSSLVTLFGSKPRKGPINKKWKVIVDDPR